MEGRTGLEMSVFCGFYRFKGGMSTGGRSHARGELYICF